MHNYYPILWVGAIIGVISTLLIVAAFVVKDGEKETGFERNMKDSEIMQRLMDYAKPFYRQFIVVGFLMLFSIAYDIGAADRQQSGTVVKKFALGHPVSVGSGLCGNPSCLDGVHVFPGRDSAEDGSENHFQYEGGSVRRHRAPFPRAVKFRSESLSRERQTIRTRFR